MFVEPTVIVDPRDPRLADYVGLTDPQIRRRYEAEKFFIAEGIEVVRRLIASPIPLRSIVVAPNRIDALRDVLARARCPVYVAERSVMSETIGFDLHRGVIASGFRPDFVPLDDIVSQRPKLGSHHRIAVLHGVGDHENLGAIVRSARAFRIDALVLDPTCADPYYRRSVRVSMGEIFLLPVAQMPIHELIAAIRAHGGSTIALTPRSDAQPIADLAKNPRNDSGPMALIFGSEGFGLPEDVLDAVDVQARIPIAEDVDSLNVGHAAAIAFAVTAGV